MKVVIPVGGIGNRVNDECSFVLKALIAICGELIPEHVIEC